MTKKQKEEQAAMAVDVNQVARNLVMVRVTKHRWNGHRSAKDVARRETKLNKATEDSLLALRQYLPNDIRKQIARTMTAITRLRDSQTVPWEDGAWRALLTTNLSTFRTRLEQLVAEVREVRDYFIMHHEEIKKASKEMMQGLWREEEFPTVDEVRMMYGVDVKYRAVTAPRDVKIDGVSEEQASEIRKQMTEQFTEAIKGAVGSVIERLQETADIVIERLSREDQKNISYGAIRRGVEKTHEALTRLNLAGDSGLQKMIDTVRDVVLKIDPKVVRDSVEVRTELAKEVTGVRQALKRFGV